MPDQRAAIPRILGIEDSDFRLVFGGSTADYDPAKNEANKLKHGYSFDEAREIFEWMVLPIPSPPFITKDSILKNGERRSNILTLDKNGKVVLIALTMRPNETIRIISMRPASPKERKTYSEYTISKT